jgi:hypothetical protein
VRGKLAVPAGETWPPWTIWVASALGLASSALLLVAYAVGGIMSNWDTPAPGPGWLGIGAAGQCGLAGITVVALVAGVQRPRWRRAWAVTAWMTIPVGVGLLALTGRLSSRLRPRGRLGPCRC